MKRLLLILMMGLLTMSVSGQTDRLPDADPDVVAGNTGFAFDLYQALPKSDDGNLLFSPYSISQAFAMAYAGAEGVTEDEMADVLNISLPEDEFHPAFARLNLNLTEREYDEFFTEGEASTFQLNIANAVWAQQGYPFAPAFVDTLDAFYGSGFRDVDFTADPDGAREAVNDWVAEATEDRITDILAPGTIDPMTRMVLANAIYFNASWMMPFPDALTADAPFTLLDGTEVTVPLMNQSETVLYADGENYQAALLPYLGGDMGMVVILPDEGAFNEVDAVLDAEMFAELRDDLGPSGEVNVYLPRFEYEFDLQLGQIMAGLGMGSAFSALDADFSGMLAEPTGENLFIGEALHKAFIKVDEQGTEAAAATVLTMRATSVMPTEPVTFRVDRPFMFAIIDNQTDSVLFLGRVMNPAG